MIDTHCHLTSRPLLPRAGEVIAAARAAGVERMITVGTSPPDGEQAAALASAHEGVFSTVGLHPHYAHHWPETQALVAAIRAVAERDRVVALGEMGLDRHYSEPPLDAQRRAFAAQLELAGELPLPIIIHNREATADVTAMIRDSGLPGPRFVFHCFTGDDAELDPILELGAMVSFTGIVTFKNSASLAASAARVPIERLMVETDSPYLTPEPHRKVKVNEPRFVTAVAGFLAARRGMEPEAFHATVDANAQRFFRLPPALPGAGG